MKIININTFITKIFYIFNINNNFTLIFIIKLFKNKRNLDLVENNSLFIK